MFTSKIPSVWNLKNIPGNSVCGGEDVKRKMLTTIEIQ
jgi:hypothetical protein